MHIELTKILKKGDIDNDQIENVYAMIYKSIEDMNNIKANTSMFLKNQLKNQLGKYVVEKDPTEINYFIEYFKQAYPKKERRKDFTWVLNDISKIADEQIWHTFTYINSCILEGEGLGEKQKVDIINVLEILLKHGNLKMINNFRSLQALNSELNIKIVQKKDKYICVKQK